MADLPYDLDEEALVRRITAQREALAQLDSEPRAYNISGPVRVNYAGEVFDVPLTLKDVRAALDAGLRAAFDDEISAAGPSTAGAVIRKWALEVIPGDELDRVDVLIEAERQANESAAAAA
ncbi:hypothetical protein ACIQU4_27610 [Streptomyces sp. NPDC090741]|uniref:hypothetical protein n=1 Tax=Streptomyces sp. NPDC090741 TaxID=3365967 RepID=UPI0037F77CF2